SHVHDHEPAVQLQPPVPQRGAVRLGRQALRIRLPARGPLPRARPVEGRHASAADEEAADDAEPVQGRSEQPLVLGELQGRALVGLVERMKCRKVAVALGLLALGLGAGVIPAAASAGKPASTSKAKLKTITVADDYFSLARVTIRRGQQIKWVWSRNNE